MCTSSPGNSSGPDLSRDMPDRARSTEELIRPILAGYPYRHHLREEFALGEHRHRSREEQAYKARSEAGRHEHDSLSTLPDSPDAAGAAHTDHACVDAGRQAPLRAAAVRDGRLASDSLAPVNYVTSVDPQDPRRRLIKNGSGRALVHIRPRAQGFVLAPFEGLDQWGDVDSPGVGHEQRPQGIKGEPRVGQFAGPSAQERKDARSGVPPCAKGLFGRCIVSLDSDRYPC